MIWLRALAGTCIELAAGMVVAGLSVTAAAFGLGPRVPQLLAAALIAIPVGAAIWLAGRWCSGRNSVPALVGAMAGAFSGTALYAFDIPHRFVAPAQSIGIDSIYLFALLPALAGVVGHRLALHTRRSA